MIGLNEQRTIARILKVNHAGEFGAIRIYRAQLSVARWRLPELVPFLTETLSHEVAHCQHFLDAMQVRKTRPCGAMSLWGMGGLALGFLTAFTGRNAIMVCTKAVEQTVHRHLEEQIHFLTGKDEGLKTLITTIQIEEKTHLSYANAHLRPSVFNAPIEVVIIFSTEIVIWLSTQGAVSRMKKAIRRN